MTGEKQSLDVVFGEIFDSLLRGTHKISIGKVVSFDRDARTCSVQPVLMRKFEGYEKAQLLPQIDDAPVLFLGSADFIVEIDLVPDSYVALLIADRSIEKWSAEGDIVDPASSRIWDLSDAIALPGLFPFAEPISPGVQPDAVTIRKRDGTVYFQVKGSGSIKGVNSLGFFELEDSGRWNVNNNHTVDP